MNRLKSTARKSAAAAAAASSHDQGAANGDNGGSFGPFDFITRGSLEAYLSGADKDTKRLLSTECEFILECKSCRNIYRRQADFLQHKQMFCQMPAVATVAANQGMTKERRAAIRANPLPELVPPRGRKGAAANLANSSSSKLRSRMERGKPPPEEEDHGELSLMAQPRSMRELPVMEAAADGDEKRTAVVAALPSGHARIVQMHQDGLAAIGLHKDSTTRVAELAAAGLPSAAAAAAAASSSGGEEQQQRPWPVGGGRASVVAAAAKPRAAETSPRSPPKKGKAAKGEKRGAAAAASPKKAAPRSSGGQHASSLQQQRFSGGAKSQPVHLQPSQQQLQQLPLGEEADGDIRRRPVSMHGVPGRRSSLARSAAARGASSSSSTLADEEEELLLRDEI